MASTPDKKDISTEEGKSITAEAATWKSTPYKLVGPTSTKAVGGDCSGITQKIYTAAHFPYTYTQAPDFPAYAIKSKLFRALTDGEAKQDGDILCWPNHVAIYSTFKGDPGNATTIRRQKSGKGTWVQVNDMWTASHPDPGSYAFGPAQLKWWRPDAPKVFRYQK